MYLITIKQDKYIYHILNRKPYPLGRDSSINYSHIMLKFCLFDEYINNKLYIIKPHKYKVDVNFLYNI